MLLSNWGPPPEKKNDFSSEKCILVHPGDGFAMDNGESKKLLRSDRGVRIPSTHPLDPPLIMVLDISRENKLYFLYYSQVIWISSFLHFDNVSCRQHLKN